MSPNQNTEEELKPLKISCTSSDCKNGLHCFLQTKKMAAESQEGRCRYCGAKLVDWNRVHKKNLTDVDYTFTALRYELIRHHYWHLEIDQKAVNHARRKGREGMRIAVEKRIRKYVGPAEPTYDGRQTPKSYTRKWCLGKLRGFKRLRQVIQGVKFVDGVNGEDQPENQLAA